MITDAVLDLASEVIDAQSGIYDSLLKFGKIGLPKEQIQKAEILYFVLALSTHSVLQWAQMNDEAAATLAARLFDQVLEQNLESNVIQSPSEAVKNYQIRYSQYRAALPSFIHDPGSFGLLLSKNMTGEENAALGGILCLLTTIFLGELKIRIENIGVSP